MILIVEQEVSVAPASPPWGTTERHLRGQALVLARVVWIGLVMLAFGLSLAALPYEFSALQHVCTAGIDHCIGYLTPEIVQALQRLGLPATLYAWYAVGAGWIFALVWITIALAIFARKSDEPMVLLVTLWMILFVLFFSERPTLLLAEHPGLWLPVQSVRVVTGVCLFLCCYLFPDGRFVPRWTGWLALIIGLQVAANFLLPQSLIAPGRWLPPALGFPVLVALLGSLVFAQVYRYRYVATSVQRQQTKWVVFGVALTVLAFFSFVFLPRIAFPSAFQPGLAAGYFGLASVPLFFLALLPTPLSIGMAVLRRRLWDIDIFINRTLLYGMLSSCIAGIYLLVVGGLGTLLQARAHPMLSLLGAGVVAVLFQPLRERLQRGVNRLMYGERDEPYRVLARLGQRLETALAPEEVLPVIVQTVREALKLPYASIAMLTHGDQPLPQPSASNPPPAGEPVIMVSSGAPVDDPLVVPLIYQGETVGELRLGPRARGDTWNTADRRLLADFARQAGVAVHAVRLTAALQHARSRLVAAREEERRRLRRDLHDGLGPALGALALSADLAHDLVPSDPTQAQALMADIRQEAQAAVQDIRRLVYALRPPALDELGLVEALRRQALQLDRGGPEIVVEAPAELPGAAWALPAAVEVAAYRIAQEAITNVVRHACARRCRIRLWLAAEGEQPALHLEVADDGRGVTLERQAGVGLQSMHERAAELGGTCRIEPGPHGGTVVRVSLPIIQG